MRRCTLCGGPLSLEGRCTECGLDNTKNDKRYRLNTHNEKTVHLHQGDCEDHLNQSKETEQTDSFVDEWWDEHVEEPETGYDKASARTQAAKTAQMAREQKEKEKEREKARARRSQTGTVKKKKRGWLGWIVLVWALIQFLIGFLSELQESDLFDSFEPVRESVWKPAEDSAEEVVVEPAQEDIAELDEVTEEGWLQEEGAQNLLSHLSVEKELGAGSYMGGTDVPAGVYRLTCTVGEAEAFWWNPKAGEGDSAYLLSEAKQQEFEEEAGDTCYLEATSNVFQLEEGGILYVSAAEPLMLDGYAQNTLELEARIQPDLTEHILSDDKETVHCGTDFPAGTYDIMLETGEYVFMEIDRGGSLYNVELYEGDTFSNFPFTEETKMRIWMAEGMQIRLIPSD